MYSLLFGYKFTTCTNTKNITKKIFGQTKTILFSFARKNDFDIKNPQGSRFP